MPEQGIEFGFVRRVDGDESFALLLVKLLFLEHTDLVVGGVHAPVFDVNIQLGQIEVRADGVAVEDAIAFVVAVGDVVRGEPIRNKALAVRLHQGAGLGGDRFVQFHLGVEVTAVEVDFVEAGVAEGALESLLAAGVFLGSGFTSAAEALVAGVFLLKAHGFANGGSGGVGGAADVVFGADVVGKVVEIGEVRSRVVSEGLEGLEGVLLDLRVRITQGDGKKGGDGGV